MNLKLNTKVLDGYRFLLALWVAIGHFYIIIGGTKFFDIPIVSYLMAHPIIAVNGFMIITGFLMTYHYILREKKEPFREASTGIKFILRRLFRLYPVYLLAILAAFFLVEYMYQFRAETLQFFTGSTRTAFGAESKMETPTLLGLVSHLFFVHGLIPHQDSTILSVAWSLSLEMQFYVLFPVIFAFLFSRGTSVKFIAVTVLTTAISVLTLAHYKTYFDMPAALIFRMPIFLLGMMVAAASLGKLKWRYVWLNGAIILAFEDKYSAALAISLVLFLLLGSFKAYLPSFLYKGLNAVSNLLSSKFSTLGADISYSLYLMHLIILPFILKFYISFQLSKYATAGLTFATFIAVNFALSYLLHLYVEKPFIRIGKQFVSRIGSRREQAHAASKRAV